MQEKSQVFKLECKQCGYTYLLEIQEWTSGILHVSFLCPECGHTEVLPIGEKYEPPKKGFWNYIKYLWSWK